jgi:hypothetical protein
MDNKHVTPSKAEIQQWWIPPARQDGNDVDSCVRQGRWHAAVVTVIPWRTLSLCGGWCALIRNAPYCGACV